MRELRFLDSSVFLHAYLKPRRKLTYSEVVVKERAKNKVARVEEGVEEVVLTVVHLSEVLNIIESRLGLQKSLGFLARILSLDNITILSVNRRDYEVAFLVSARYNVSVNDALAYVKMREMGINEIYAFDKHFRNLPGTKVITS